MPRSGGASPRERQILQDELAVPLKRLRRTAGDPTCGKIAEAAGLSRNTVDNVFNARRLARFDTIEAIVTALDGDVAEWRERWAAARDRIDDVPAEPDSAPPAEEPPPDDGVRRVRQVRRPLVAAIALLAVGGVISVAAMGDDHSGAAPAHRSGGAPAAHVQTLAHDLVYVQCADRARSVLTRPGRSRGGRPLGQIVPGERFTVTGQTAFWKYGHTDALPTRNGWVLADYLCHTG